MKRVPEHIEILMAQYFDQSINEVDRVTLENWLSESTEHQRQFEQNRLIWQMSAKQVNVDEAWGKVANRLNIATQEKQVAVRNINWFMYFRNAAAILLVLFASYFVYYQFAANKSLIEHTALQSDSEVLLAEGSIVKLEEESSLFYPEQFNVDEREVVLKGKAFFEVTKNPKKPFVVDLDEVKVTVLGTSFFIEADEKDDYIKISVNTGRVKVQNLRENQEVILTANESITYNKNKRLWTNKENFKDHEAYWLLKTFEFKNLELIKVFQRIEDEFMLKITYDESLASCKFSARIETVHPEDIIKQICLLYQLEYVKNKTGFEIVGQSSCE